MFVKTQYIQKQFRFYYTTNYAKLLLTVFDVKRKFIIFEIPLEKHS